MAMANRLRLPGVRVSSLLRPIGFVMGTGGVCLHRAMRQRDNAQSLAAMTVRSSGYSSAARGETPWGGLHNTIALWLTNAGKPWLDRPFRSPGGHAQLFCCSATAGHVRTGCVEEFRAPRSPSWRASAQSHDPEGEPDRRLAVAGAGIVFVSTFLAAQAVDAGKLRVVLDDFATEGPPVSAIYLPSRQLSSRVRAFVELVAALVPEDRA